MIIEKINEVNERVEELMKAETQIIKKIEELQNMLKEIDNEKMVLKGSYNTLVALGTELGEIEVVNENGVTKVIKKEVNNEEKDNNKQ